MEIGVFEAIPMEGSMGVAEIAQECAADETLIGTDTIHHQKEKSHAYQWIVRLMRQLTTAGIFTEAQLGVWAHNRLSMLLSTHHTGTGKYFMEIS